VNLVMLTDLDSTHELTKMRKSDQLHAVLEIDYLTYDGERIALTPPIVGRIYAKLDTFSTICTPSIIFRSEFETKLGTQMSHHNLPGMIYVLVKNLGDDYWFAKHHPNDGRWKMWFGEHGVLL
jgi:hypothetical protein